MRIRTTHIVAALAVAVSLASCDPTKRVPEGKYLLDRNKVVLTEPAVAASELEPIIKQRPNKRVLWMRTYLWFHNIPDPEKVARRKAEKNAKRDEQNKERVAKGKEPKPYRRTKGEWLREVVGEAPVVLDTTLIQRSHEQIRLYMQKEGWFRAEVSDTVIVKKKFLRRQPSAIVQYTVRPGPMYRLRNIGFEVDDPVIEEYVRSGWKHSLIASGDRFDADVLDKERARITDQLRELGYLFFNRDLVHYDADTAIGGQQVDVMMHLERAHSKERSLRGTAEGTIFSIKDVTISTAREFREGRRVIPDTLLYKGTHILFEGQRPLYKPQALLSAVFLKPGQRFQQSKADRTYRRLTGLRVFDRVEIGYDTTGTGAPGLANTRIDLLPGKTQSVSAEGFGTNRGGFLGIQGSVGYRHRNLFRGMGLLTGQLVIGLEAQQSITGNDVGGTEESADQLGQQAFFNTIHIGPELSLHFPHFLLPFVDRERFARSAVPRTAINILYNYQRRPDFTRTLAKMSYGYEWAATRISSFGIYPLEVNVIKIPQRSAEFQNYLEQVNDPVLTDSYTDHLIAGMRGQMTFNTQQGTNRRNLFYSRTSIEWAGNPLFVPMSALGEQASDTAGNTFFTVAGVRYAEYFKVENEFRYRQFIHDRSSLAFRLSGGIGIPYGNLGVLPFESSFFVGGANGLRAWRARSLGPGSYSAPLVAFDRTGEIRIEANAEYRFGLIGFLEGALFADAGNIWNIEEDPRRPGSGFSPEFVSEIAIGTGFGARLNFDFFLVRFDLGLQTKDPSLPPGERWLFEPKTQYLQQLTDLGVSAPRYRPQLNFNLGIGYPF